MLLVLALIALDLGIVVWWMRRSGRMIDRYFQLADELAEEYRRN
jgi:hypothetical protein